MQNLERRLSALEQASPTPQRFTIIRRIVRPGHLAAEIHLLRGADGQLWGRLPGETEQDFEDRASGEVKRNEWGIGFLVSEDLC